MAFSIKSKTLGLLVAYCLLILNTVSNILLVPIYLRYLGIDGYGFYQMIYSTASYILVLDFGISSTMIRFISEKKALNDRNGEENIAFHCAVIVGILIGAIVCVGLGIRPWLGEIFPTLTPDKVILAKKLFSLMIVVLAFTVLQHFVDGVVLANEEFTIAKMIGVLKIITKFCLVNLLLYLGKGVISLVIVDVISSGLALLLLLAYAFQFLHFRIRFHHLDSQLIRNIAIFMLAFMLQSIVGFLMNTSNKTLIGMKLGENSSGLYALATTFITLFNMLPTAILSITLPKAMRLTVEGASMLEHSKLAARIGRLQMVICAGFISGFIVCGYDFVQLWSKLPRENCLQIYGLALIVILPNSIPLIQNYCLNVLDALNKRIFRSVFLLFAAMVNVVVALCLISRYGVFGPAYATSLTYLAVHGIIMNLYYKYKIGLNIWYIWKTVFRRLLSGFAVLTVVTLPLYYIPGTTYYVLLFKGFVWLVLGIVMLKFWGLNGEEKEFIGSRLGRFRLASQTGR